MSARGGQKYRAAFVVGECCRAADDRRALIVGRTVLREAGTEAGKSHRGFCPGEIASAVMRITAACSRVTYSRTMVHVLELFVSEHCLGCPEARRVVRAFAAARPDVMVVERDVEMDADRQRARAHGLFATPALVIDGGRVMYGVPRAEALVAHFEPDSIVAVLPPGAPARLS